MDKPQRNPEMADGDGAETLIGAAQEGTTANVDQMGSGIIAEVYITYLCLPQQQAVNALSGSECTLLLGRQPCDGESSSSIPHCLRECILLDGFKPVRLGDESKC